MDAKIENVTNMQPKHPNNSKCLSVLKSSGNRQNIF